jgi:hypothetical protein
VIGHIWGELISSPLGPPSVPEACEGWPATFILLMKLSFLELKPGGLAGRQ